MMRPAAREATASGLMIASVRSIYQVNYMSAKSNTPERDCINSMQRENRVDSDEHIGAVEGDRPSDSPQQGNANAPAIDEEGLPDDPTAIAQDVIGANLDETEG
jgi:hypothetical protein